MFRDFREREKPHIDVRKKHGSFASCTLDQGLNPKPRHVPWWEIEPATFLVYGTTLQPVAKVTWPGP